MSRWLATMDSCTLMGCSNIHSTPCRLIVVLLIINGSVFRLNKTNIVFPDHFLCKGYPLQRKFQLTIRQPPRAGNRIDLTTALAAVVREAGGDKADCKKRLSLTFETASLSSNIHL